MSGAKSAYRGSLGSAMANGPSSVVDGFTLLELMISLTIMGLVLVLVFGSLRIGARAWEKGERDVEVHQRQRVILDNLRRQISSACFHKMPWDDKDPIKAMKSKGFFRGDSEGMAFVSRVPMSPLTQAGLVYAEYAVREDDEGNGQRLLFREKDIVFITKEEDLKEWEEDAFFELIPGTEMIAFAYMKGSEEEGAESEWLDEWDGDAEEGLPLAVRVTLQIDEDEKPIYAIMRLQVEPDAT